MLDEIYRCLTINYLGAIIEELDEYTETRLVVFVRSYSVIAICRHSRTSEESVVERITIKKK